MSITFSNLNSLIPRRLWLLLLAGLILRVLFSSFHQRSLISDEKDYNRLAYQLSATGSYEELGRPTAYRSIGYPGLVAAVYAVVGHVPIVVKLLQAVLDTLTALLIFILLQKEHSRSALWGAAFWLFYPSAVLYTNFLLSETVFAFILVLAVVILQRVRPEQWMWQICFGALVGILILIKPFMLGFILILPLVLWRSQYQLRIDKWIALGAFLILAPWVIRNALVLGSPTLATNGGMNLLIGNNPSATGGYAIRFSEDTTDTPDDEVAASHQAFTRALGYILEYPDRFLLNGIKKVAHLVSSQGGLLVWTFHESPEDASIRYAKKYRSIPLWLSLVVNVPFALLLLTGILGYMVSPRDIVWWTVTALVILWIGVHFIFFGGSRFLFPLFPFLALFSGIAITKLPQTIRQLSRSNKFILAITYLGLIAVWGAEAATLFGQDAA